MKYTQYITTPAALCFLLLSAMCVTVTYAGSATGEPEKILENPIRYESITDLLLALLSGITLVLIPIMTLAIVYIGFNMVIAGYSKPEDFKKYKEQLMYALLGLFLVLGARGILSVVRNTVSGVLSDEDTSRLQHTHTVLAFHTPRDTTPTTRQPAAHTVLVLHTPRDNTL